MFEFKRGISQRFVDRLNEEYERGGWWRAIVSDPDLFVAIRAGYLNVYWNGNSLLKVSLDGDRLVGETHYKYLLHPEFSKPYVTIHNGLAVTTELPFLADLSNVALLKRAAAPYAGGEKQGVHCVVMSNPNVLDVEVAFGTNVSTDEDQSRIDFAALRTTSDGAQIVLYEAKLFSNSEVRAEKQDTPPVVRQIERYEALVSGYVHDLESSYQAVCGNLAGLCGVRNRYSSLLDLMRSIAEKKAPLRIERAVRLVLFGFDADQRDGRVWGVHRQKLQSVLGERLLLKGDPKGFTRGIST